MKSAIACLTTELEFFFSYLLLLIVTIAALYNITQSVELEFSKILLTTAIGIVAPSPRLKNDRQNSDTIE